MNDEGACFMPLVSQFCSKRIITISGSTRESVIAVCPKSAEITPDNEVNNAKVLQGKSIDLLASGAFWFDNVHLMSESNMQSVMFLNW